MSRVNPASRHVYKLEDPSDLQHITTDGVMCWCEPEAYMPCTECPGSGEESKNCYKCGNGKHPGLIEVTPGYNGPLVIIHNDR